MYALVRVDREEMIVAVAFHNALEKVEMIHQSVQEKEHVLEKINVNVNQNIQERNAQKIGSQLATLFTILWRLVI